MMTAEEMDKKAHEWIALNPAAWKAVENRALDYNKNLKRVSMDYLMHEVRHEMKINGKQEGFKINNNIIAPLARFLVNLHPCLDTTIERRKSKVDAL